MAERVRIDGDGPAGELAEEVDVPQYLISMYQPGGDAVSPPEVLEPSGTKGYEKCVRMKRTFCSWLSNI